ncbi:DUF2029 domain-containing protein [Cellulomonas sp. Sa3CUA2]|uniref:DUF2029 domain-containing protein n=1 Tax=Cellulomonas avistercoris TaxID=2762242 RepID=A0ABR8Q8Y1_9CELL|nr:glycosyltransferase 87 family protein [Cellulomonas avistercoris]MBD7916845.1 DUF2029 domain-containing protein [Cellulomonas avistercoris]
MRRRVWGEDVTEVVSRHPRLVSAATWLWRRPLVLLVPLAVVLIAPMVERAQPVDALGFVRAGRTMLSPEIWSVFADPWLQVGPLLVLSSGVWATVADALGLPALLLVATVHSCAVIYLGDVVTRLWVPVRRDPTAARWAVGAALTVGGVMERSFQIAHEEDLVVALLLAAAAAALAGRHVVRGGVLLALAFGFKAWAVLGGGLVLTGRSPRRALVAGGTALAVVVLMFLPFVVWGEVRTLEHSWGIADGQSLFGRLGRASGLSDWGLRAVQAAVAGLAGAAVALRRHGSVLAVVITAVAVRLLLEPHLLDYYCSPLVLLTVLWAWTTPDLRARWVRWATLGGTVVFLQHYYFVGVDVLRVTEAATYVLVLALVLGTELRASARVRAETPTEGAVAPASTGRDADTAPTGA